jgi:hypothetical protein
MLRTQRVALVLWLGGSLTTVAAPAVAAEKLSPAETAAAVDRLLAEEVFAGPDGTAETAPACDDATFLKRTSLDLIGQLPTPEQVTAFALDPLPDKRARLVDRLLADDRFAMNWARYWRDVILYRRSEDRALLVAESLETFLAEQFRQNAPWDQIAKAFVTAEGDVREHGETALFMAQGGATEETAAEVARIFLGIQIQCAQCHDHPTDRWKRQQFHELAAFLPRVELRPVRDPQKRSFEIVGVDREARFRGNPNLRRATLEHYMPDLQDPTAQGTLMTPKFFVTGRDLEQGADDERRRSVLANWLVADSNPWFTRALVNRLWGELVGEGFYEPLDDMGPDRQCTAPQTLDVLAEQFRANRFDVRWLYRTITGTVAYQRESRSRRTPDGTPFVANCSQRLRADQLYDVLTTALGTSPTGQRGRNQGPARYGQGGPRGFFAQLFGFDPSEPREEIAGSIPQALALMNSPLINQAISARRPGTGLSRLLAETADDEEVVVELYLRCLAREPKPAEIDTCLEHVRSTGNRGEAFEDILWALINSTEFMHRN